MTSFFVWYVANRAGLYALDAASRRIAAYWPRFPRPEDSEAYYVSQRDVAYLGVNSLLETCFLLHVRDALPTAFPPLSPVYCVFGVYILFWLDDLFYTWFHALLHRPRLYTLLHAHHHAVTRPTRGYVDAGNEHPLEQCGAMFGHMCAIRFLVFLYHGLLYTDVHVPVLLHLTLKALGSCLNHVDHAVYLPLGMGVCIDTAYHREHHTRRRCNYAQFVPMCDRLVTRGD